MKTIWISLALLLSLNGLSQNPNTNETNHPVYNYFLKGINDFNQHKLEQFLSQFDEDIQMFTHNGWIRSKKEVANRFSYIFKQFPNIRMQIDSLNVRQINENTVLVDFTCQTFPNGTGPAFHTVGSGVYVWRRNRWIEVFEHETLTKTDAGMFDN
jgi:hypothetical protein